MENGDPLSEILIDKGSSFNSEYESLFKIYLVQSFLNMVIMFHYVLVCLTNVDLKILFKIFK